VIKEITELLEVYTTAILRCKALQKMLGIGWIKVQELIMLESGMVPIIEVEMSVAV
jgi:hypothetical protein